MNEIKKVSIKLKEIIDVDDYEKIKNLEKLCLEADHTSLKLELDYKLSSVKLKNDAIVSINEFMYYSEDDLIGYMGICDFGGEDLEVNGMVHPSYRRKGIFKRLFSLVEDEWQRRSKSMLLLSDNSSIPGIEFIKSVCNNYEHSEYDMLLDMDAKQEIKKNSVKLRKAEKDDAKEIAKQNSIYFNIEFVEEDNSETGDNIYKNITYMAELDNHIIGKVRIEKNNHAGGIYGLGVLPEYRNKGYGREILIMAVDELKKYNANKIFLQVLTNNKNALNLYKSCGFEEKYTMDYYKLSKNEESKIQ